MIGRAPCRLILRGVGAVDQASAMDEGPQRLAQPAQVSIVARVPAPRTTIDVGQFGRRETAVDAGTDKAVSTPNGDEKSLAIRPTARRVPVAPTP